MVDGDDRDGRLVKTRVERGRFDIVRWDIKTDDMTAMAADVAKKVALYEHAVPARNKTYRVAIGAVTVGGICWLAFTKLPPADLANILMAAVVAVGAVFVVREFKKPKK